MTHSGACGPLTNETLQLLAQRRSTRTYAPTPLSSEEREAVLGAALQAPTAGGMVLYSIIEVTDQALKDRLAVTCDDQPFIAKAPWVLVFVADYQKWTDLFAASRAYDLAAEAPRRQCGPGDLLLACCDALIAAQNAVVAAASLGIGSCYIGDILERGEEHAELLRLPPHTLPVAMLCFGHPLTELEPIEHFGRNLVHENRYERMTSEQCATVSEELGRFHAPHGLPEGVASYPQVVYRRKVASAFMNEMNRSVAWWLGRWQRGEGA